MRRLVIYTSAVVFLALPGWPQTATSETSTPTTQATTEQRRTADIDEVKFLDSREAYWVNKGFSDMLYCNGGGTFNAVRAERDKFRADEALNKITKPMVFEVKVDGKTEAQSIPTLKMGGKEVKVP